MPIDLYSGTPGSGKSLHMAQDIYNCLRNGKNVIANFRIDETAIKPRFGKKLGLFVCMDNKQLTIDHLQSFAFEKHRVDKNGYFYERQTYIFIDEAQILFNARSWNEKGRDEWIYFFTQHRKFGFEIVIVAMCDRFLDRQIRTCIENEYKHRKINNFKFFGKLLAVLSGGNLFISVHYWYPVKEKADTSFFRGKNKYYRLYNSYKIFSR